MQGIKERVNPRQLLKYPTIYPEFNHAYETVLAIFDALPSLNTMYVVQYQRGTDRLCFTYAASDEISAKRGQYKLEDIRGIVERGNRPYRGVKWMKMQ